MRFSKLKINIRTKQTNEKYRVTECVSLTGDSESTEADSERETLDSSDCVCCVTNAEQKHRLQSETCHTLTNYIS